VDDHFSKIATQYVRGRMGYPGKLYEFLASQCAGRGLAYDCACGSGQAAVDLTRFFEKVMATDISAELLALAPVHPDISYRRTAAEDSGIEAGSVDLLVVAQALHWFDLPRFWTEVGRVLKSGGIFAFWGYNWPEVSPSVDRVLEMLKQEIASYWPEKSEVLHNGYRSVDPPFPEVQAPVFRMSVSWMPDQYLFHLRSWSATRYFNEREGGDIVGNYESAFLDAWGTGESPVGWPLVLKVYRNG
jgi:SAM-dependent methyltransferase